MIGLEVLYVLKGALAAGVALVNLHDRGAPKRLKNAAFWGLWAVSFLLGSRLGDLANGALLIAMALVAGIGGLGGARPEATTREQREASARRWGNLLFVPALIVPLLTLVGTLTLKDVRVAGRPLVDPRQVTLVALAFATLVALAVAMAMLRPPPSAPVREARRLMDSVGWAAALPQALAALGAVFAAAGVGAVVTTLAERRA